MAVNAVQPWKRAQGEESPPVDTHEEPPPSNQPYRPALDGVRALAILPVLIFHLKESWFPGGFVGVDVFFVISGFLITNGLLRDLQRGSFSLKRFYQRRIARLFPSMAVVVVATGVAALLLYDRAVLGLFAPAFIASVASVNNLLAALEGNYFSAASDAHPFLHFWSLSVEEQFYLFFPLLLLVLWRWRRRGLTVGLALVALLSLLACIWETGRDQTWAFYMLPTRAWELLAGSLLAALPERALQRVARLRSIWAAAGLLLLVLSFALVRAAHFPGAIAMLPVTGTVLLIVGVGDGVSERGDEAPTRARNMVEWALSISPLVETGRLSYVLYLWHLPIFSLVDYRLFLTAEWKRVVLKLVLTAGLAFATAYLVENPARWWLNRRENRTAAFAFALTTVVLVVLGGSWMRVYGWPEPRVYMMAKGGLLLNRGGTHGSITLVGDSQACATATMLESIAVAHGMQLHNLCMSGTVPLLGVPGGAWERTLEGVKRVHPDVLVYEMAWPKQPNLSQMLANSVAALSPYTKRIVLVAQYPVLLPGMPREALRDGMPMPFYELPQNGPVRQWSNGVLRTFAKEHGIPLIEMDAKFTMPDGSVRLLDEQGRPLYFDWMHATAVGTATYRDDLQRAVTAKF